MKWGPGGEQGYSIIHTKRQAGLSRMVVKVVTVVSGCIFKECPIECQGRLGVGVSKRQD